MYYCKLSNTPDINWVDENKSCINLYALEDMEIHEDELKFITFNGFKYEFSENVVGILFVRKPSKIELYYPKSILLKESGNIKIRVRNSCKGGGSIFIAKGEYLATIKLMTTQFYELMSRNDNSDKGLRSAFIKIEFC